jgi:cell division septation protein DedD
MRGMTRDYAGHHGGGRTRNSPRSGAKGRRRPDGRAGSNSRAAPGFSAPSFSAGVILGAAIVLLASYAPSAFDETVGAIRQQVEPPAEEITFEFPDMLEQDTVIADPSVYPSEFPGEDPDAVPRSYIIQAASLRGSGAAAALSAELRTAGLTASWERVDLSSGTWYRVMVGPFDNQVEANRALTLLRKRNLGARLIRLS